MIQKECFFITTNSQDFRCFVFKHTFDMSSFATNADEWITEHVECWCTLVGVENTKIKILSKTQSTKTDGDYSSFANIHVKLD